MNLARLILPVLVTLAAPLASHAGTVYYLVTGQSSANTTIDSDHEMQWIASSMTAGCLVTSCTNYSVADFDATFDWSLGGGNFTIKTNGGTNGDITLSIWDGGVSGTLASPVGTLVDSVTVAAGTVSSSYTPTDFIFTTPVTILTGHHYTATLTSPTGTNGNQQYDIKGIDTLTINSSTDGGGTSLTPDVPEPSTGLMMLGSAAFALVAGYKRRNA